MYKPPENKQLADLKSHGNRSHNQDSQLIALVKCMARLAAEEDFKARHAHKDNQNIKGNEL